MTMGRRWYLVAWDMDREDWRTFRVDRLADPRSTRWRFTPREVPGGDAAAYVRTQLASFATRYEVEAMVERPADEVAAILGTWASVTAVDEGSCRVTMSAEAVEWPAMALAGLGAPFRIVGPPELRTFMADAGRRFLAAAEA